MDQLVQCPVCTLYLHNGMSLESHLDTHPKDQVIKALCSLSSTKSNYGSRSTTPMHSERSYRSRSRTPAMDERSSQWPSSHGASDKERYWKKSSRASAVTRTDTPADLRMSDLSFESATNAPPSTAPLSNNFPTKIDLTAVSYAPQGPSSDYNRHYVYIQDPSNEEGEIKYSRSAEYHSHVNKSDRFAVYQNSVPEAVTTPRFRPVIPKKHENECVDLIPCSKANNNIALVKANLGAVQYVASNVKPVHFMVPAAQAFVHPPQNQANNLLMPRNIPDPSQQVTGKNLPTQLFTNQFNHITSGNFTPSTSVVTQSSQIIYREMVHNIDGKPFISTMPAVLSSHDDLSEAAHANSLYRNVMLVNPYGNGSVYPPQQLLTPTSASPVYHHAASCSYERPTKTTSSGVSPGVTDANKTLVIEVGPIGSDINAGLACKGGRELKETLEVNNITSCSEPVTNAVPEQPVSTSEMTCSKKGLKILSNIKVEVPVQHHKSMLHTVVDLTGPQDEPDIAEPCLNADEKILPDLDDNKTQDFPKPPTSGSEPAVAINTFSVIKNIGNPSLFKESTGSQKTEFLESKDNDDSTDTCPVPDLICNEKPSISPCSELSGDMDRSCSSPQTLPAPSAEHMEIMPKKVESTTMRVYKNNPLKLNNIYVKKNKKILQIKNAKMALKPTAESATDAPGTSTAYCLPAGLAETFKLNNVHCKVSINTDPMQTLSMTDSVIEKIENLNCHNDFDADTEEQSMDIEPITPSSITYKNQFQTEIVAKEEVVTTNFIDVKVDHEIGKELIQLEPMRPGNVIAYGNMINDGSFACNSVKKSLFDSENVKTRQAFVSMMSENYFGENIYPDYFAPDRVESLSAEAREPAIYCEDVQKTELNQIDEDGHCEGEYLWGDGSQRDSFVLPAFIHDTYKLAEGASATFVLNAQGELEGGEYHELTCRDSKLDMLSEERSEQGDVALNICADERMPPRGELSGQESNGDMDTPWTGMYPDVNSSTSYDLMARETWLSDASDVDTSENRDNLEEELQQSVKQPQQRSYKCATCGQSFPCPKERRVHRLQEHPAPSTADARAERLMHRRRLLHARTHISIKKEEKIEDIPSPEPDLTKGLINMGITSTVLEVFETIHLETAEPKVEQTIVKEERRKRKDYVCAVCKEDLETDVAFHAHLKIHPLECLTCGKYFFRRANLQLHIRTHLGIRNYKCDLCEKRFLTKQKLQEHHNSHTGAAPIKCSHCDETFRRYSNMVQHRNRHHFHVKRKVKDYVCHCGSVFHSRRKLLWHKETHEDRPKACPYCSDKFIHASSLTRHVRRAHNGYYVPDERRRSENVPCPICKQVYLKNNMDMHLRTHTGKKPYLCVICNKAFTTKWNLKLHRWTHANRSAKPFKCSLCKGAFVRQSDYVSHMNAHKSVRPYTCNYCGCQFIRKYNCQRHVKEHESVKRFVCKVAECGKSFHRSYYLTEHMRVHSGVRPFACNICGKTSSNKSNHNKHVKIHHAREPVATES